MKIVLLTATTLESKDTFIMDYPILQIGVGKINSAMTTVDVILKYDLSPSDLIINFGSCGQFHNTFEKGKILEVGTVHNDIDCTPIYEYGHTPFTDLKQIKLISGTPIQCITTDRFYDKNAKDYSQQFNHVKDYTHIVDMELYAIAQVCKKYNVPIRSYKWVSDNGEIDKWKDNANSGYENFKKLIEEKYR